MLKLLRQIEPYRWPIALVLLLAFLQSLANLYLPRLMAGIVDRGIVRGDTRYILTTGGWMLLITIGGAACAVVASYFSAKIAIGFGRRVRVRIFAHVAGFSLREFDTLSTASLITRTTNDTTQVQQMLTMVFTMTITAPMMVVGGIILALSQDATLTWVLIAGMPIIAATFWIVMRQAVPLFQLMQLKLDKLNLILDEVLGGVRVIRAFDRSGYEHRRFDAANLDVTNTAITVNRIMAFLMPAMMLMFNFSSIAIIWFGGIRVDQGQMQIGSLIAFLQYAMFILFAVLMMTVLFVMLPRAAASAKRINEVLDIRPEINDPAQPQTADERRGQVTAIIGGTGSGKSALVSLITRFYDANEGRVLVDGMDVRSLAQAELRAKIGFVPQQAVLFSGSIAENIRYGKEDATDAEVEHAAAVAQVSEFIEDTAAGFAAVIAQGGSNVSGGQRQRISIARALVRKPEIYVFDDSFSALDFSTEARLRTALKGESQEATMFIVSQRVGTIMDADQILVLDEGRLVGIGTHDELLQTSPVYREIVSSQLSLEEVATGA